MHLILFDEPARWRSLLPFTHTRPVSEIRCGIYTASQRWDCLVGQTPAYLTEPYLQEVYPRIAGNDNLYINSAIIATPHLAQAVSLLQTGEQLTAGTTLLAFRTNEQLESFEALVRQNAGSEIQ